MLVSLAASEESYLEGSDVSNAYLHGDLDVPVIMELPTHYNQESAEPRYACKLIKSIYGAKHTREIWGSLLDKSLRNWGFNVSKYDGRFYFFQNGKKFIV